MEWTQPADDLSMQRIDNRLGTWDTYQVIGTFEEERLYPT